MCIRDRVGVYAQCVQVEHIDRRSHGVLYHREVHHIAGAQLQKARSGPVPVGYMVPLLGLQNALLGPPRPKQDNPGIQPLLGRKQQREGRQVGGGGQIQPAEAPLALSLIHI